MSLSDDKNTTGSLHISFDFEAGWGVWENGRWKARQARGIYRDLRPALQSFMNFLADRDIELSWATVGGMITPDAAAQLDHLPPAAQLAIREFIADAEPMTRDGRDLFDIVAGCRTKQQIGSHSFSHTRFTYPGYGLEAQTQDLALAQAALKKQGHSSDMFVFPVNDVDNFAALGDNGIRVGRTRPVRKNMSRTRLINRAKLLLSPPPYVEETVNQQGVVEHSGSLFFNWYGRSASLRRVAVKRHANMGLNNAVRDKRALHLWLHPFNLVESKGLMSDLMRYLDRAASLRDKGRLSISGF